MWEFISVIKTEQWFFSKTITAFLCFVFSYASLSFHHLLIAKIIKPQEIKINKILWIKEFFTNEEVKIKFNKKFNIYISHIFVIGILIFPMILGELTTFLVPSSKQYFYNRWVCFIAIISRNLIWLPSFLIFKLIYFSKKPKLNKLAKKN